MSSIAQANKVAELEQRIAALEAVFSRPVDFEKINLALEKMKNDIQGLKMRMGKSGP